MKQASNISPVAVGLALFSMFFGSGNLVFPLVVGTLAEGSSLYATLGFVLGGVLLPFFGIFTMLRFQGEIRSFFHFLLGPRWGFYACLFLLSVWIPFGSAPRCVTVSYAAIKQLLPVLPLWSFSLVACVAIYPVCINRSRMMDVLGYVLTPILLVCLGLILALGLYHSHHLDFVTQPDLPMLWTGLKQGYNTMDLIASIFFSAVVVAKLKPAGKDHLKLAWKSGLIGASLLGLVYVGFITVAASHGQLLAGVPRDELLLRLAQHFLGQNLAIVPILAVALSCITTCIALTYIFSDFLMTEVFPNQLSMKQAVAITTLFTFTFSNLGFDGIAMIAGPLLQLSYPLLIVLMCVNLLFLWRQNR